MCLVVNRLETLVAKTANPEEWVERYKVLYITSARILKSYHFFHYQWSTGVNKADQWELINDDYVGSNIVHNGIHVFVNEQRAKDDRDSWCLGNALVVVKAYCQNKDLLAIGDDGDAVYTQVTLKEEDYNKAINEGNPVYVSNG